MARWSTARASSARCSNKGYEPSGKRALQIGAGGAGSAIALALIDAGVRELALHDEDQNRRDNLIGRLNSLGKGRVIVGSPDPTGFDLIANATPAGMKPTDPYPVDVTKFTPAMFVGCVITQPAASPMVEAARKVGCNTSTGTDMYQALQSAMVDFLLFADTGGEAVIRELASLADGAAYDLIVVGAGGAGMAAALFGAIAGKKVLLIERTEYLGGTTALSAATTWIPEFAAQPHRLARRQFREGGRLPRSHRRQSRPA